MKQITFTPTQKDYINDAIKSFIKTKDNEKLVKTVKEFAKIMHEKHKGKNKGIWFRFPSDSTLATTPQNLESFLLGKHGENNRRYINECLELSVNPDGEDVGFTIFYS